VAANGVLYITNRRALFAIADDGKPASGSTETGK
jgi:hypothetical protein